MTQTQTPEVDPLEAFESRPSVSFDASRGGYAKGQKAHFIVQSFGELIIDRDSETKEVNYWPLRDGETERQPKKKYVLNVLDVTNPDEHVEKTLWAKPVRKGAAMFAALIAAQKKAKEVDPSYRLKPGDELFLVYTGDDTTVPAKMGNHPKKFAAKIIPGAAQPTSADPFADEAPSSSATPSSDPWAEEASPAATPSKPPAHDSDPFGDVGGEEEPPF